MSDDEDFGRDTAAQLVRPRLEQVVLRRDCAAIRVPGGDPIALDADTEVTILQSSDAFFTIQVPTLGVTCRMSADDADSLGKHLDTGDGSADGHEVAAQGGSLERQIDAQLRRVYDPELPVNVVDLGLVYDVRIFESTVATFRVEVDMSLTTRACGMGAVMTAEVTRRVLDLARVDRADVRIVWEPAWSPQRISAAGRKKLGIG